jgi:MurNAc alpha-1-phosphate uridylyltransferase
MLPVAILAGGLATRLRPITETIPKSMIEICGKPFAHWQAKQLAKGGVKEIVYCLGYKSELIEEYLGDGSQYGLRISYSHDGPRPLGTGGAIVKALPKLGEKFMILYGDSYLPIAYSKVNEKFDGCLKPALMTVFANNGRFDSSNVEFKDGVLIQYKKGIASPEMTHIDYGLSCVNRSVFFSHIQSSPLDLAQVFTDLVNQNLVAGYEADERFYEIGSRQGILDFTEFVERNLNEL